MTGEFPLNWATLAVSIFNTILLLWLGLTVLLNAQRRTTGVWIAGTGLLMSSLFFLSHTAILGLGPLQKGMEDKDVTHQGQHLNAVQSKAGFP